jgi:hypothetical protein
MTDSAAPAAPYLRHLVRDLYRAQCAEYLLSVVTETTKPHAERRYSDAAPLVPERRVSLSRSLNEIRRRHVVAAAAVWNYRDSAPDHGVDLILAEIQAAGKAGTPALTGATGALILAAASEVTRRLDGLYLHDAGGCSLRTEDTDEADALLCAVDLLEPGGAERETLGVLSLLLTVVVVTPTGETLMERV